MAQLPTKVRETNRVARQGAALQFNRPRTCVALNVVHHLELPDVATCTGQAQSFLRWSDAKVVGVLVGCMRPRSAD